MRKEIYMKYEELKKEDVKEDCYIDIQGEKEKYKD